MVREELSANIDSASQRVQRGDLPLDMFPDDLPIAKRHDVCARVPDIDDYHALGRRFRFSKQPAVGYQSGRWNLA